MARQASDKTGASDDDGVIAPEARADFIAPPDFETGLAEMARRGELSNGWLIAGGEGAGKATLAFRIARALLEPAAVNEGLQVSATARVFSLVASGAHPDLFVARRQVNERTGDLKGEISVDTIRELTAFMGLTPSFGGWRVAIVDTADDLNRNAANALLKVLEEPPKRTAIFLLSAAPGRLLPTIRSRCRRLAVPSASVDDIIAFLERESAASGDAARRIAGISKGRPGRALALAAGEGARASELVDGFMSDAARANPAAGFAGRASDALWRTFLSLLLERLDEFVAAASGAIVAQGRLAARDEIRSTLIRGDAVNLDKAQLVASTRRRFLAAVAMERETG